jgi:RTX calcium-binding nonapeptide repeat (4 copies)
VAVRGKTLLLALVAALSLLSATAVAGGHRVVKGTKGGDELTMSGGGDRVFARAGDDTVDGGAGNDRVRGGGGDDSLFGGDGRDRLRGGQDNDLLDGGDGNDYLNGGGDGRDKDRIVCGDGYDVVVLGKNDVVLVEVAASGDVEEDVPTDESVEPDPDEPELEKPAAGGDGCEKVKRPGSGTETCASIKDSCERESCASTDGGCEPRTCASSVAPGCYPSDEVCAATHPEECDDPGVEEPEPDPAVEVLEPDEY